MTALYPERKIMRMDLLRINPDGALKFLETCESNRNIQWQRVLQFANDMTRGAWRLTHQGIAFNEDGKLIDGQHRLWAVVESKTTQRFYAATYEGKETALLMPFDMGLNRTTGDRTRTSFRDVAMVKQMARVLYGPAAKIADDEFLSIWEVLKPHDVLSPRVVRFFSLAPLRAAIVLRNVQGFDWSIQYRALVDKDHESMSPITGALFNRLMEAAGKVRLTGERAFGLGWYASDPEKQNNRKFGSLDGCLDEARAVFRKSFPRYHDLFTERGKASHTMPDRFRKMIDHKDGDS